MIKDPLTETMIEESRPKKKQTNKDQSIMKNDSSAKMPGNPEE